MVEKRLSLGIIEVGSGAWIQHSLAKQSVQKREGLQISQWFPTIDSLNVAGDSDLDTNARYMQQLSLAAERFRQEHNLDLCLAAGVYPTWAAVSSSTTLPSSDFSFSLARRDKETKQTTVSLGAHPDVLYHRLAKAGLNFLRLELLQRG